MEESHFWNHKHKMWPKCYCRTSKRKQFTTIKYKEQNNRKIQETQTSVTFPGGFSTKIIPYVDFTSHGSVSKIQTQEVCKTITFVSDVDVSFITLSFNDILMRFVFYCITICKYCQYSATLGKVEIFIFYQNN